MKDQVNFINNSGLDFTDISSEEFRSYTLCNGDSLYIENPLYLNVSQSGGHRVFDAQGNSYYIQPKEGWVIQWKAKPGQPNFVK